MTALSSDRSDQRGRGAEPGLAGVSTRRGARAVSPTRRRVGAGRQSRKRLRARSMRQRSRPRKPAARRPDGELRIVAGDRVGTRHRCGRWQRRCGSARKRTRLDEGRSGSHQPANATRRSRNSTRRRRKPSRAQRQIEVRDQQIAQMQEQLKALQKTTALRPPHRRPRSRKPAESGVVADVTARVGRCRQSSSC